jgi:hypothetical protein
LNSEAPNATGPRERAEHGVVRRPPASRAVAILQPFNQPRPEILEVHRRFQNLKRIAILAQAVEMLRKPKQT